MKVTTVGVDLAKNVFQVHGVDAQGKAVLRKKLERGKVLELFMKLAPCLIGMEACGSAHYWARKLQSLGHSVNKLIASRFVKPYDHLKRLEKQVDELDAKIQQWHRESEASRKLSEIPGIGPITASALVASIGDAKSFKNGRQLAAWLGLVAKQHFSGGKSVFLRISKRGDLYLRPLLIHRVRAGIRFAENKPASHWFNKLLARRSKNVAAMAPANKYARIVWALLMREEQRFWTDYTPATAGA